MRLIVSTDRGPVGTITYENGQLTGSDPGLQEAADIKVEQAGSAEAAFQMLSGYSNGYITYVPEERASDSEAGKLDSSRELITEFLRGEISQENERAIIEDDVLLFAVARLDEADPDWILGQLSNRTWPIELRAQILQLMVRHCPEGYAILGREAPELLRTMPDPRQDL
jgi:hypothetical protein